MSSPTAKQVEAAIILEEPDVIGRYLNTIQTRLAALPQEATASSGGGGSSSSINASATIHDVNTICASLGELWKTCNDRVANVTIHSQTRQRDLATARDERLSQAHAAYQEQLRTIHAEYEAAKTEALLAHNAAYYNIIGEYNASVSSSAQSIATIATTVATTAAAIPTVEDQTVAAERTTLRQYEKRLLEVFNRISPPESQRQPASAVNTTIVAPPPPASPAAPSTPVIAGTTATTPVTPAKPVTPKLVLVTREPTTAFPPNSVIPTTPSPVPPGGQKVQVIAQTNVPAPVIVEPANNIVEIAAVVDDQEGQSSSSTSSSSSDSDDDDDDNDEPYQPPAPVQPQPTPPPASSRRGGKRAAAEVKGPAKASGKRKTRTEGHAADETTQPPPSKRSKTSTTATPVAADDGDDDDVLPLTPSSVLKAKHWLAAVTNTANCYGMPIGYCFPPGTNPPEDVAKAVADPTRIPPVPLGALRDFIIANAANIPAAFEEHDHKEILARVRNLDAALIPELLIGFAVGRSEEGGENSKIDAATHLAMILTGLMPVAAATGRKSRGAK